MRGKHVSLGCKLLHYFLQNRGFSGNNAGTRLSLGDFSWPCHLFGDTGAAHAEEAWWPHAPGLGRAVLPPSQGWTWFCLQSIISRCDLHHRHPLPCSWLTLLFPFGSEKCIIKDSISVPQWILLNWPASFHLPLFCFFRKKGWRKCSWNAFLAQSRELCFKLLVKCLTFFLYFINIMCKSVRILMESTFPLIQAIKCHFVLKPCPRNKQYRTPLPSQIPPTNHRSPMLESGAKATAKGNFREASWEGQWWRVQPLDTKPSEEPSFAHLWSLADHRSSNNLICPGT